MAFTKAKNILALLGGSGRLTAMIGARNFLGWDDGLSFTFPHPKRSKPNAVRVIDAGNGTYTIEFYRLSSRAPLKRDLLTTLIAVPGVDLRSAVEHETGLALSLGNL